MNDELVSEYMDHIIRKKMIEKELRTLPKGYISKKRIGNKEYQYLQNREQDKIVSIYIKKATEKILLEQLELRKQYEKELPKIKIKIQELREAALEIDESLYRKLLMMEHSYGMDELTCERKEECLAFASAVNAVEGVGASMETLNDLQEWKKGSLKFIDVFENVFRR